MKGEIVDLDIAKRLADLALDRAEQYGAWYADIRFLLDDRRETVEVKNDIVESAEMRSDSGVGVRVLVDGAWGFSGFSDLSQETRKLEELTASVVSETVTLARTSARLRESPLYLAPMGPVAAEAYYETPFVLDPFALPLKEKIALLRDVCAKLNGPTNEIAVRTAELAAGRATKFFASSEYDWSYHRRYLTQAIRNTAFNLSVVAIDGNEMQQRESGVASAAGYELIASLDVDALAEKLVSEAIELLSAPECPPGISDIIILPEHLGLHLHETGHGFEGDRLLGYEQTYVGNTFINEIIRDIGSCPFASEAVSITADATTPGGYGTFAYDDEGVPAQKIFLVENGVIKNVLTSRETVGQINRRMGREYFAQSNGTMRASSYSRMPLIRMTNVSLVPGEGTLDDLIARVDCGLLLDGTQSWSMSEDRKNFDFGVQYAREIRNGKLGRVMRNAGYTGSNLAFWKSCEAVAGPNESFMLNVPNCGKGQPGQTMSTGHETSPALFRNVEVFNRKQRGGA